MIEINESSYYATYRKMLSSPKSWDVDGVISDIREKTKCCDPAILALVDHLIEENNDLKSQLEKIKPPTQSDNALQWEFDGSGEWTAASRYHDDGLQFKWVIGVRDDGTFTLAGSDSELGCKSLWFRTLTEAKEHCQIMEKD
jgi:hypothetical protein